MSAKQIQMKGSWTQEPFPGLWPGRHARVMSEPPSKAGSSRHLLVHVTVAPGPGPGPARAGPEASHATLPTSLEPEQIQGSVPRPAGDGVV